MSEQTFEDAVRESRVFYRRRLAERLACVQLRTSGTFNAAMVVKAAAEITDALETLETGPPERTKG